MATIDYTVERIIQLKPLQFNIASPDYSPAARELVSGIGYIVTWVLVSGSLDGQWLVAPVNSDINVQAYGSDWNAQTLNIQGSNETDEAPSNPINLKDALRNTIAMTGTNETEQILDNMYQYRPLLGGNPTNSVTVKMLILTRETKTGGRL